MTKKGASIPLARRFLGLVEPAQAPRPPLTAVHVPPHVQEAEKRTIRLPRKIDQIEPPILLAALLSPNLTQQQQISWGYEKPTCVMLESPRKLDQNRTETMAFSDEFDKRLRIKTHPSNLIASSCMVTSTRRDAWPHHSDHLA